MKTVICDLDGTLFDIDHRLHYLEEKNYDAFWSAVTDDTPNDWCVRLLHALMGAGYRVVFVTGRNEITRGETARQLLQLDLDQCKLIMRPRDNRQADRDFKQGILNTELAGADILFAIEDRLRVTQMWRDNGIVALQCDEGDF